MKSISELLQKVEQLGALDIRHKTLEEASVNLGVPYRIWGIAYLSGRKA